MATTQEALDLKHDLLLMEQQEKLETIFSKNLLKWASDNDLTSFAAMQAYNGELELRNLSLDLKGLEYFKELTEIDLRECQLSGSTVLDVGIMTTLTRISIDECGLTSIDNLNNLSDLSYLSIVDNELTEIDFKGMEGLVTISLRSNSITSVKNVYDVTDLESINLFSNQLSTETVDNLLSNLLDLSKDEGYLTFVDLRLNGTPTNGDANSDFENLVDEGVVVHIQI